MNQQVLPKARSLTALAVAIALSACGGGGGGESAPPTVAINGVAADGPLQGANACYDLNDNGRCDPAEPASAATDASGAFRLDVAAGEVGKHRVVVEVPATAIDQETGQAVGQAFTMQAPASGSSGAQDVFVSPLTTLVQVSVDTTGVSVTDAAATLRAQAGLALSPLANYNLDASAAGRSAAALARVVQLAQLQQDQKLAPAVVDKTDLSGATISAADLERQLRARLLLQLPALAAAAADSSVVAAPDAAARLAAIDKVARDAADALAPTADEVRQTIGAAKLPSEGASDAPSAGVSLRQFQFTDRDHWFYRALEQSAADDTADTNGRHRYYDVRSQATTDVFGQRQVASWGFGNTFVRRADLHWNGSAWVGCELGQRSSSTGRDAKGSAAFDYCDGFTRGTSTRGSIAIAGQSMRSVIESKLRTFVGSEAGYPYASFGPANLDLLGNAVFPDGAKLYAYTETVDSAAMAYDVQPTNIVTAYGVEVAAGGDARSGSPACGSVTPANAASMISPVHTLEDLIARSPGRPCLFAKGTNADGISLDPNEWWTNGTASLGSASGAATQPGGTGNFYTTTAIFRVGFDATGNGTRYYSCLERKSDGSVRNCSLIGSGSYRIDTLGDARVLSFVGLPALTQKAGFERVFVERGGSLFWGYRNLPGTRGALGLNLEAASALFRQLGLRPIAPIPPASAAESAKASLWATAKGVWAIFDANNALVFRFGDGGSFVMAQTAADSTTGDEQPGLERGWLDIDPVSRRYQSLLAADTNWHSGTSHPDATSVLTTLTATQLGSTNFTFSRLPDDPNGIVGYWAVDSPTNLATQQFVFFANGRVLMIDPIGETAPSDAGSTCFVARQGPPGIEWASYTFDPATGALHVFDKKLDTNGCAGLFDSSQGAISNGTANTVADFVLTFSPDKNRISVGPDTTLYRIATH